MNKYIFFLHCKNNVMRLTIILLVILCILFIYSYFEDKNIDNKQIEKFGNINDPLFRLVTCNEKPFLNCDQDRNLLWLLWSF